jgi:hypothetical protein
MDIWTPDNVVEPIFDGYMDAYESNVRSEQTKVQIGRPEWWYVADLLDAAWKPPQGDDTYLLVRFSFSLEPPEGHAIEQARLTVQLGGVPQQLIPVAFDLFPFQVTEEVQRDIKLTFAPSLKLEEIEASIGSAETTIHVSHVEPVISAFGLGTASPAWIFRRHPRYPLLGSRLLYAVIAYPSRCAEIEIQIDLTAAVHAGRFGRWRLRAPETSRAALNRHIP